MGEKLSLEQGESVSAPPEEEQVAERICGEQTTDPISYTPASLGERR